MDTRIAYGALCTWWGPISSVGRGALPCCPRCRGPLFEVATPEEWWAGVDRYAETHPGYRALIEWTEGKCFKTMNVAREKYEEARGA